jgi:hypothetical protein
LRRRSNGSPPPGTPVICHDPQAPLRAGLVWLPLPTEDIDAITDFARNRSAPLIVLKSSDCTANTPEHDQYLRPFTLREAIARDDILTLMHQESIDGEEVAILAPVR